MDKLKELINEAIKVNNQEVDLISKTKRDGHLYLEIALRDLNDKPLTLEEVVKSSELINPIVDELDLIEEEYILDIFGKEYKDEQ